jgi:hypothetical protein
MRRFVSLLDRYVYHRRIVAHEGLGMMAVVD